MEKRSSPKELASRELAKRELARRYLKDFIDYTFEDPRGFNFNWHHEEIIKKLQKVEDGEIKRLMIFMPPRHGKSEIGSIRFPAWLMGKNKDRQIIQASYSGDLATDFGRQVRNLVNSEQYRKIFTTELATDSQSKSKWNTDGRGVYNAVGVGGSVTGKGADILIIDDPIKNRQEAESETVRNQIYSWYQSTARTRVMPGGAIIVILTRWHDDDLAGKILEDAEEGLWDVLHYPAIAVQDEPYRKTGEALWEDWFNLENLNAIRKDIGPYEFSALYQGTPVDDEAKLFKTDWIKSVPMEEVLKKRTMCYITYDVAFSQKEQSDYIGEIINFVDEDGTWHVKSNKIKLNPAEFLDRLFIMYNRYKPEWIGIEAVSFESAVKPFLDIEMRKRNFYLPLKMLSHKGVNKYTRIQGLIPRYSNNAILHIEKEADDLEDELNSFPKGKHDDVIDALAYQLDIAESPRKYDDYLDEDLYEEEGIDQYMGI